MRKSGLTRLPLKDRSFIREVFAELCADASIVHANVHIVLAALAFDLPKAVPARAVVSARIVMPNTGAAEFRDLLPNCGQMHEAATDHRPRATPTTMLDELEWISRQPAASRGYRRTSSPTDLARLPLRAGSMVKERFAEFCAGLSILNGNVHMTFASILAERSGNKGATRAVVTARVVMPLPGAVGLWKILSELPLAPDDDDSHSLSTGTTRFQSLS